MVCGCPLFHNRAELLSFHKDFLGEIHGKRWIELSQEKAHE